MTPDQIEPLFTLSNGNYRAARWGRPIVPVVFGVDDATLSVVKGAIEAVVLMAGHSIEETDPELGANMMFFFFRDWAELPQVPNLDRLIPNLGPLCDKLTAAGANQYRTFRFDEAGAIKAVFTFLRMDEHLSEMPAADLALAQAAQAMLAWSEGAFATQSPLARVEDRVILRPEIAGLIVAAYDPRMPAVSTDPTHALRLAARISQG